MGSEMCIRDRVSTDIERHFLNWTDMAKFTVKEIEALDCGAKPRKVAVGEDGLYLLVRRNQKHPGRFDKYWRYDYKFDGKAGTASYGVFPRVTLVKAKEEHLEFKRTLRSGTDPREQRRREKVARQAAADNTLKRGLLH